MELKKIFAEELHKQLPDLELKQIQHLIEKPKKAELGDFAFPCFVLAKQYRKAPQQIAADLAEKLEHPWFAKVEAVGPYVNLFLDVEAVSTPILQEVIQQGRDYGSNQDGKGRNVTLDLSSPNIAKPFSMGHLRSTVIGNAIANLAEKNGYRPVRINYIGDWGTQFGKLIAAYKRWGDDEAISQNPIPELLKLYVKFHEEAEQNADLEAEGRKEFKKLEDGDPEAVELWKKFRAESLKEFQRIYDLMGISFDSYKGEAFYNDKMEPVIHMLEEKGLLEESEGARVVKLDEYHYPPSLIQKSDGATLYATRDLASAFYRKETYDFAKSIYVVGNEQSLHFAQLKAVLQKAGYDWAEDMVHVGFGMMLQNGKKMSTRKGRVILLEEVLQEAIDLAYRLIEEKNPALENKQEVARQVGIGAVIFQDLKHYRTNDIEFSLEAMLQFDGETGPYLQYTHARCCSLLRKAGSVDFQKEEQVTDAEAWPILQLIASFPQVVRQAWQEYDPSKVARMALDLARAFNQYYAHVRILSDDKEQNARLQLVYATAIVLQEALNVLGMEAPEEM